MRRNDKQTLNLLTIHHGTIGNSSGCTGVERR